MSDALTETQFGFSWGPAEVERLMSDPRAGVVLQIKSSRQQVCIRVTPGGLIRVAPVMKENRMRTVGGRRSSANECWTCGAPIEWAVSSITNGDMPFDAEPCPKGHWELRREGQRMVAYYLGRPFGQNDNGKVRRVTHFGNCEKTMKVHRGGRR